MRQKKTVVGIRSQICLALLEADSRPVFDPHEHEAVHVLTVHQMQNRNVYRHCDFAFGGDKRAHAEPEFEKLKVLLEYIIGFGEWLKKENIQKIH